MGLLKYIAGLNKKIPKIVGFVIGLVILNIPPIIYLTITGTGIAPMYVAVVFLLINIAALIAYFKLKEIEVESKVGRIRARR